MRDAARGQQARRRLRQPGPDAAAAEPAVHGQRQLGPAVPERHLGQRPHRAGGVERTGPERAVVGGDQQPLAGPEAGDMSLETGVGDRAAEPAPPVVRGEAPEMRQDRRRVRPPGLAQAQPGMTGAGQRAG